MFPIIFADDSNFKVTGTYNEILEQNIKNLILKVKNYLNNNSLKSNVEKTELIQFQNIRNENPS
jgi:hypothetical protein